MKIRAIQLSPIIKSPANRRRLPDKAIKSKILQRQKYTCFYCGILFFEWYFLRNKPIYIKPNYDHFFPYCYSFNSDNDNFVAACSTCNQIKSGKIFNTPTEAITHVRQQRRRKNLPMFKLQNSIIKKEKVAEILLSELPVHLLLENPSSCSISDLLQHIEDIRCIEDIRWGLFVKSKGLFVRNRYLAFTPLG